MASELKVNKITPESGATLTLGDSGDTINFGSGVLPNFENLTVTGDLTVDTNSLKVDSTNNFVGIGTATPAVALDVVGAITATGDITGTLATAAQPNITSLGTLTGLTTTGDINFGDNDKAVFGASSDLQIYHTGAASVIREQGTGSLYIDGSNEIFLRGQSGFTNMVKAIDGGAVELYHNNSGKLATTSSGIDVIGTVVSDGLTVDTNTLYVDSANDRVGIGTSSPSVALDIRTTAGTSAQMNLYSGDNTTASKLSIAQIGSIDWDIGLNATDGHFLIGGLGGTVAEAYRITRSGTSVDNHSWSTGGSERMRIDSSGNVGIGTSSPADKLHVDGAIRTSNRYLAGSTGVSTPDYSFASDGSMGMYRVPGSLCFSTGGTERMRIDSSGNLLVGTTTANGRISSTPLSGLSPAGTAGTWATSAAIGVAGAFGGGVSWIDGSGGYCAWVDDGGNDFNIAGGGTGAVAAGGVYINNYAGSWSSRSDERDKINLEPITDAATKIQNLRAVIGEYSWAEGVRHPFLIAQDVQKVLPEAVSIANKSASEEEQRLGMSYTDMVPLLTAALQEALGRIETLEAKVEALENA